MDALAAELLMPRDLLMKNLSAAGIPQGIRVLNPVWRKAEYGRFLNVCDRMGVSKQALAYRLGLLGLAGENQMYNPDAMIDIWMDEEEAG